MKCLIVDDNKIARMTLMQIAAQVHDLEVTGDCSSAAEAYDFLRTHTADLILLDIEMPGMSGLELTKIITDHRPLIIFTTSKKEYAAEAFELNVVDYLLKPITPARFIQAVNKARTMLESNTEKITVEERAFIFIKDASIVRRLQLDEILFAEAMGDYVKLHTARKFFAVHSTLKSIEEHLPAAQFIRVHRSYIVAISKIDTIQDGMLIINGNSVPVADAYRGALNRKINII